VPDEVRAAAVLSAILNTSVMSIGIGDLSIRYSRPLTGSRNTSAGAISTPVFGNRRGHPCRAAGPPRPALGFETRMT
jgi:hypothetical protein